MGILKSLVGGITYNHELINHSGSHLNKPSELDVENLEAIFIETAGELRSAEEHAALLNHIDELPVDAKTKKIIQTARWHKKEIWFGDVKPTFSERLRGVLAHFAHPFQQYSAQRAAEKLSETGSANGLQEQLRILTQFEQKIPETIERDKIMAAKISVLAAISKSDRIGILTGARHVNLSRLLRERYSPTPEEVKKIATRDPHALKMFRCIYDKQTRRWRVEEHSL